MNWKTESEYLAKEFVFSHYAQAIRFVNKILPLAQAANHHPDILIYDYRKVRVMLSTHSEQKITSKDFELAEKIDMIEQKQ